MNSGDLTIDMMNVKKGNVNGLDVDMGPLDEAERLDLNYSGMGHFDKKIMKRILQDEMVNVQNVKEAVLDPKKGVKPFFVQKSRRNSGSVTFLPSPASKGAIDRANHGLSKSKLEVPPQ